MDIVLIHPWDLRELCDGLNAVQYLAIEVETDSITGDAIYIIDGVRYKESADVPIRSKKYPPIFQIH